MTERKSNLWDIHAIANVTFTRVSFKEEVTLKEALKLFQKGDFKYYEEERADTESCIEYTGGEAY